MVAGFTPPGHWTETASQLRRSATVTLDSSGNGVVSFSSDNANQRWVITSVVVSTNQSSTATLVPYATVALNTTSLTQMSPGNNFGATYDGNNDSFSTAIDMGPCDFLSVLWYPPPGQSGSSISGVIATAVIGGTKYTRRG